MKAIKCSLHQFLALSHMLHEKLSKETAKWQVQQINNVNVSSLANNMLFQALIKAINLITLPSKTSPKTLSMENYECEACGCFNVFHGKCMSLS
jgi:hypothetical protein